MIVGIATEPLSFEREQGYTEEGSPAATVVVTLESGISLRLYEGNHIAIISTDVPRSAICVLARPMAGAKVRDSVTPRIERSTNPASEWSYDLYGTVEKTGVELYHGIEQTAYVFDVGVGTLLVGVDLDNYLSASDLPLDVGDALSIPTKRLELYDDGALRF